MNCLRLSGQMTTDPKIEFNQLTAGFEFPARCYTFDSLRVLIYLKAVRETNEAYLTGGIVPPMLVTAYAMAALSGSISMPAGTIHVTQELDFLALVKTGDTVTCCSKVSRKQDRGGMHIMSTDIVVTNQRQEKVLTGRVGFILPDPVEGKPV
jgi:acyl-coenzyme A thioesterase PaaI-like protein